MLLHIIMSNFKKKNPHDRMEIKLVYHSPWWSYWAPRYKLVWKIYIDLGKYYLLSNIFSIFNWISFWEEDCFIFMTTICICWKVIGLVRTPGVGDCFVTSTCWVLRWALLISWGLICQGYKPSPVHLPQLHFLWRGERAHRRDFSRM